MSIPYPSPGLYNSTTLGAARKNIFEPRLVIASTTQLKLSLGVGFDIEIAGNILQASAFANLDTSDNLIDSSGGDAGAAMAAGTTYHIYLSNSSPATFPLSMRGSTTAPSTLNGVYYLGTSGDAVYWRYAGIVHTDASTHFNDSLTKRNVASYYNRLARELFVCPNYNDNNAQTTYNILTGTGNWQRLTTLEYCCFQDEAVLFGAVAAATGFTVGKVGIAINGTSALDSAVQMVTKSHPVTMRAEKTPTSYFNTAGMFTQDSGTITMIADFARNGLSSDPPVTFFEGVVWG